MRLARLALIFSIILMGNSALHAQTAHAPRCDGGCCDGGCAGGGCGAASCGCNSCCSQGLLPDLKAKFGGALAGLLPGHIGGDARHKIYKAALHRSTFDKKCLLPLPYYSNILPIYKHDRCCCGPTTANCPTCGPHDAMGEEIIEMHEVPQAMPAEPTPATQARMVPNVRVTPKTARVQQRRARSATPTPNTNQRRAVRGVAQQPKSDRTAMQSRSGATSTPTLRNFTPMVLRPTAEAQPIVRQVSAQSQATESEPANPLR